jgi:2-desacetyl-2-hydroxyethyl bacteriochlorophyllide A dehydrogenase
MKAMVLRSFGEALTLEEVDRPRPGPGDGVVRVGACGVCGTDVKIWRGEIPPPIITLPHIQGHEVAGVVDEVGGEVSIISPGDRVVAYFYIGCGECEQCRTGRENICVRIKRLGFELRGGFAEYICLPASHLLPIGPEMPFATAAVLPDAVAVPYHAVVRQAGLRAGQTALIVGAGGVGIHAVQVAKLSGARVIVADVSEERLEVARRFGADETVNVREGDPAGKVRAATAGSGVDAVIENVGSQDSLGWSITCLKRGARLVIVGYTPNRPFALDTMAMHYNEWEVVGSRVSTREELARVIDLVQAGKIHPYVTRSFSLEAANEALAEVAAGRILGRSVLAV